MYPGVYDEQSVKARSTILNRKIEVEGAQTYIKWKKNGSVIETGGESTPDDNVDSFLSGRAISSTPEKEISFSLSSARFVVKKGGISS